MQIAPESIDPQAVLKANEQLWKAHPELHGRQLSLHPADTKYRQEWMRHYLEAEKKTPRPPPPQVQPQPVPESPLPVLPDSPTVVCGVPSMTHEQKMETAINRAHESGYISDDVLKELPGIGELVVGIVVVGGVLTGLGVAAGAVASTGVGAVLEGIAAAIVIALAAIGVFTSALQIKDGIVALMKFYDATRCDRAKSWDELDAAGHDFSRGIAKAGVGTIMMILSILGGRKGVKMAKGARARWNSRPPVRVIDPATLERVGKPSGVSTWREGEVPYHQPPEITVKPGETLDVEALDPDRKYLWVVDEEGNMVVAPEEQPGFGANDSYPDGRSVKHGDLVPGPDGETRGVARAGGELVAERDAAGNPTGNWIMNNDSSYTFNRLDNATGSADNLGAVMDLMTESGTDTSRIVPQNTSGTP